jgi:hypothetical protein
MTKPQIPINDQFPMTNFQWRDFNLDVGTWTLVIEWDLGLGHWDFRGFIQSP